MKIGLFDSGLGGLLVLKAVVTLLPDYDYEYYGDTAHVPYGDKSETEIYRLTKTGVTELFDRGCVLVILACNTASAETLRRLQDEFLPAEYSDRRILGVIIPMIEEVIASQKKKVLLFGTRRTVSSGKYHLELGKRNVTATKIEAIATPGLVPLIESGQTIEAADSLIREITEHLERGEGVDGVILGCTHYALLKPTLEEKFPSITFFAQTDSIPLKLAHYLSDHKEIETRLTRGGSRNIYLTEQNQTYDQLVEELLQGRFIGGEQ